MRKHAPAVTIAAISAIGLMIALFGSAAAGAGTPGSVDRSYGTDGKVVTAAHGLPLDALVQSNGDLLVAMGGPLENFLNNGSVNTGFGSDGISDTAESPVSGKATIGGPSDEIALESGGDIVEAGEASLADGEAALGVTRLTSAGALETSFGKAGKTIVGFNLEKASYEVTPDGVVIEPSGKILVAVNATQLAARKAKSFGAVIRLDSNGTLDSSFGSGGIARLPSIAINTIGVDSAGDVFVLRLAQPGEGVTEIEISPSGHEDPSVTAEPIVASSIGFTTNQPRVFESNGESLAAPFVGTAKKSYKAEVEKITAAGALDPAFTITPFRFNGETSNLGEDIAFALALEPDGKIVAVGSHVASGGASAEAGIARLDENGTLDTTFANAGTATEPLEGGSAYDTLAIEPNGNIIAIGGEELSENTRMILVRYLGE